MSLFFQSLLKSLVDSGLAGVALVDRDGRVVELAGEIAEEEAMPIVALVIYRGKSPDLAARLFDGEIMTHELEGRVAAVAVAKRQLFVVATLGEASESGLALVGDLRDRVAERLADKSVPRRSGGAGGSGSGPAELPLIELGITVPRAKA